MKNKKYVFIGVYILLTIIELFFYVPYEKIEIFRSDKNVPHTEIIGNGYMPLDEIRHDKAWLADNKRTATGKRVDSRQLVTNLFMTTISALYMYFILIYPDDRAKALEIDDLKKENEMLNKNVGYLYEENKVLCEYKTIVSRLKDELAEMADGSNMQYIEETPILDIDSLAFADEETQDTALKDYTENIVAYTAYKIYKRLENEDLL